MTITISTRTESLLKAQAARTGENTDHLADTLLIALLEEQARDFEEACEGIAEGLADGTAGREISLEAYRAQFDEEHRRRLATETSAVMPPVPPA